MTCLFPSRNSDASIGAAPLAFPVSPIVGESIAETVLRAAADNSYQNAGHVLLAAGISYHGNFSVGVKAQGRAQDLAITLGVPEEVLRKTIPYPVPERPGWSDFFGVPLRNVHRDIKCRRVSPISLKQSLHLKAIWSVKALSFDPMTKEQLLDRCPECSCRPTYRRTYGLQYCEFCNTPDEIGVPRGRVDFRDFPQPRIEVGDMEALDFVSDLIDPERLAERDRVGSLHVDLRKFDRSQLFEFVMALASVLIADPAWKADNLKRPSYSEYSSLEPGVLAKAGRVLLDWPRGFHEVADHVRSFAPKRTGFFGVRKELAPLVAASRDTHLVPPLRSLIKRMVKRNMEATSQDTTAIRRAEHRTPSRVITISQASEKYGIARSTISRFVKNGQISAVQVPDAKIAPILMDTKEVASFMKTLHGAVGSDWVAARLGVPRAALKSLAKETHITPASELDRKSGHEFYLKQSVEHLVRLCSEKVRADPAPKGAVRISKAVSRLGIAKSNPWADIFDRILRGGIEIWKVEGRLTAFMTSHSIRSLDELSDLPTQGGDAFDEAFIFRQEDAASYLGTTAVKINQLVRQGLLPSNPTMETLRKFDREFVLTAEITTQLFSIYGRFRWRDTPQFLRAMGIEPVAVLRNGSFVWRRPEVSAMIENASLTGSAGSECGKRAGMLIAVAKLA
jgi:hypothetical protein